MHEPLAAWGLLDRDSLHALLVTPKQGLPQGIILTPAKAAQPFGELPLVASAHQIMERASGEQSLMLTAAGALSRADTRALFDLLSWPDYQKNEVLAVNKVLNETDVVPILITRIVLQAAGLLRKRDRKLLLSKKGQALLDPSRSGDLFAALFEAAFWRVNLGYFDRSRIEDWPQDHIGIVMWCLSVAASGWTDADTLAQVCTIRDERVTSGFQDHAEYAFTSRVLWPLSWFGLIERMRSANEQEPRWRQPHVYRKTPLFDEVIGFKVAVPVPAGAVH